MPAPPTRRPTPTPLVLALLLAAGFTALRVAVVFLTPAELYPDEAQYWLWSRDLAWGYYSKPPMVAWLIAGSTAVGGDAEAWVRLPAALAHGLAALAIYGAGARLYSPAAGLSAAVVYTLMPAIQLSSGLMTTDAPLLLFLSLALWSYAAQFRGAGGWAPAAGLGAFLGLALLSKYAALYFIIGLALHAAMSQTARRSWSPIRLGAVLGALAIAIAPNLIWNAAHGFSTVSHTAANANWGEAERFNPEELLDFVGAQFGVFGPIPFALLAGGAAVLLLRRRLTAEDRLLLALALPALIIVAAQAFISRANANWAAAAYVPGSVLLGAWLVRWGARRTLVAIVAIQGALAAVFLSAVVEPRFADRIGLGNGLKRVRGWAELSAAVEQEVAARRPSAVAVDDRFLFNALAYYGRDTFGRPGAPPLTIWVREATPQNQAETQRPLRPGDAGRLLAVSLIEDYRGEMAADFQVWRPLRTVVVRLDAERTRETMLFEASGYVRGPRDPATGLPVNGRAKAP